MFQDFKEEEGDPHNLFLPRLGSAPRRVWPKHLNACVGHEHFMPTKHFESVIQILQ